MFRLWNKTPELSASSFFLQNFPVFLKIRFCFRSAEDFPGILKFPKGFPCSSKILQDFPWISKIFQDSSRFFGYQVYEKISWPLFETWFVIPSWAGIQNLAVPCGFLAAPCNSSYALQWNTKSWNSLQFLVGNLRASLAHRTNLGSSKWLTSLSEH